MKTNTANISIPYLTFLIGNGAYGVPVSQVQNIVELSRVGKLRNKESVLWGYIQQRGADIPVVDKRNNLGENQVAYTDNTCAVIVETSIDSKKGKLAFGLIVDSLQEVTEVCKAEISENPDAYYLFGTFKRPGRENLYILKPDALFNEYEIEQLIYFKPE